MTDNETTVVFTENGKSLEDIILMLLINRLR